MLWQAHLELPLINSFCVISVYIIICITVNRYIAIYKPFAFKRINTLKNARLCIGFSFISSILLHIPFCFRNEVVFKYGPCSNSSNTSTSLSFNETGVINFSSNETLVDCGWQSVKNTDIADTDAYEVYLVVSQIFNRVGPIVLLAILNTQIVLKFLRISKELEVPGAGTLRKHSKG